MTPSIDRIIDAVAAMTGFDARYIRSAGKSPKALSRKAMVFWIAKRFGYDLLDVCDALNVWRGRPTVDRALARAKRNKLTEDARRIAEALEAGEELSEWEPDPFCALDPGDPGPKLDPAAVPDFQHPPEEIARRVAETRARLGP